MIFRELINYFGQLNFKQAATSGKEALILKNMVGDKEIFVAILDNTISQRWNNSRLLLLHQQMMGSVAVNADASDILYLLVTDNTERDKSISISGINVWLINSNSRQVLVFENQKDDFYRMKDGITAAINDTSKAKFAKTFRTKAAFPYMTVGLIVINVLYFIIVGLNGNIGNTRYMLQMGASYAPYVFENHEFWRLITCMFLHYSLRHLAGNMVYLALMGYNFERAIGHTRFLLIYLLSGLGSSIVSAGYYQITGQNVVSAGASGAVYGMIALSVYLTVKLRGRIGSSAMFMRVGIILIFLFYSNFANGDGIDVPAHIGGFVFGLLLSFLLIGNANGNKKTEKK